MRLSYNITDKIDPISHRSNNSPLRIQLQLQGILEEHAYFFRPVLKRTTVPVEENQIVHIADVPPSLQGVLRELIKDVEVNVGEKLAGKVSDRQPLTGRN